MRLASCPSRWPSLVCKRLTPLVTQAQVQTTQKGYKTGRMVYNELEQGGILSDLRFGLALLAYTDILLCL
jgi:hypothetical protein